MGLYDTVVLACPSCGGRVRAQSKTGPCLLETYPADTAPSIILGGIIGDRVNCDDCDGYYEVIE